MAVDPRQLLLAQLAGAGGGGAPDMGGPPATLAPPPPDAGPPPDTGGGGPAPDPLEATQQVIQDIHALIAVLPDPAHTRIASQCLTALAGIQKDLMTGGPGQAQSPSYGGG